MASSTQRIEIRVDDKIKQLAERAAAAAGCTLTEYVTRLIAEDAPKVLKTHSDIRLTNEQFDRFMAVCEASKPPGSRILEAAKRLDQEGF